jgi:uncharacterized surface protein with fasciclin (FAS1) repeats
MANIVEDLVSAGSFKTLVKAVKAAGLQDTLSREGPFTVFAPSDEAFAKLPEGTVENLLKDPKKLKSILTYHVVPGKVTAAEVKNLRTAKTVQGQNVRIDTTRGVRVNDANVVRTDMLCDNGVVHTIDRVIMPE